jgi:tetratricopeptide (TPR) repeat protein
MSGPRSGQFGNILRAVALLVVILAVYWPSLRGGFIWDDVLYLRDTPSIHSADGLSRIWFSTESRDYYPLTYSAFWLQWRLWEGNTLGYHLVNLLLHAAGAVLVWWLLARMSLKGAWLAALLFAVHPINVSSVGWICELKNVLALPLSILAVITFQQSQLANRWSMYAASLSLFVLALMAKSAVVGLPIVLVALTWWPQRKLRLVDCLRVVPFLAVAAAFGLLAIWFQKYRALSGEAVLAADWQERLAGAGHAVWFYLLKEIAPFKLSMIYPQWQFNHNVIGFVPLVSLVGLTLWLWTRRNGIGGPLLAGLACYVALLLPVLGFVDQGFFAYARVADHWQYFALPVVCALVAEGSFRLVDAQGVIARTCIIAALSAVVLVFGVTARRRAHAFRNDESLWRQTILDSPNAWLPYHQLAGHEGRRGDWKQATAHYQSALAINPDFAPAHYNLATALIQQNDLGAAAQHLERACRLKPGQIAWEFKLGEVYLHSGQTNQAVAQFQKVLGLDHTYQPARQELDELNAVLPAQP